MKYRFLIKPTTPITKQQWDNLSTAFRTQDYVYGAGATGKAQWDVMSALRGPDARGTFGERLKLFTTSIIRARVSRVVRVGGLINVTTPVILLPKLLNLPNHPSLPPGAFDISHFSGHICEAAWWLGIPIYFIKGFSEWCEQSKDIDHWDLARDGGMGGRLPISLDGLAPESIAVLLSEGIIEEVR